MCTHFTQSVFNPRRFFRVCRKAGNKCGQTYREPNGGRNLSGKSKETHVIFSHFLRGSPEATFTELLVSMTTPFLSEVYRFSTFPIKAVPALGRRLM